MPYGDIPSQERNLVFEEDRTRRSEKALQLGFANDSERASSVSVDSSGIETKERTTLNPFGKLRMKEIPTANRPNYTDRTVGQDVANAAERTQQCGGKWLGSSITDSRYAVTAMAGGFGFVAGLIYRF